MLNQETVSSTKQKPVVRLVGKDGNAFTILGKVRNALKKVGMEKEAQEFMTEAMSGDYDRLLQTAMKYAEVE
jgi:hypothetical protein